MMVEPRISIVMPMRNVDARPMLDSLLQQKISMQIIAVDDCSDDDTVAKVRAWSHQSGQPVEILRNQRRLYSYGSRLKGLARASAPIIWNVDADDHIPENADIGRALRRIEAENCDIIHFRAVGVEHDGSLQKSLPWSEPVAATLRGGEIYSSFMEKAYPPAILWNKFFSLPLCKKIVSEAPDLEIRYFDVKFLGILALLLAQSYIGASELVYEYKMRSIRHAWLYARQVKALIMLETALVPLVRKFAGDTEAFVNYCRRRLVIQTGHLAIMAREETRGLDNEETASWLESQILSNISLQDLTRALNISLAANSAYIKRMNLILSGAHTCNDTDHAKIFQMERRPKGEADHARGSYSTPACLAPAGREELLKILFENANLARLITSILAPDVDITKKAN